MFMVKMYIIITIKDERNSMPTNISKLKNNFVNNLCTFFIRFQRYRQTI